jgi:hypothetical protein
MGSGIPKASRQIKKVIDRLKEGPAYQSKLEKLKDDRGRTIPHTSLNRILNNYLLYWGLVEKKQEGKMEKWVWRDLPHFNTWNEYKVALKHSQNLIPGLKAIRARIPLESLTSEFLQPTVKQKYLKEINDGKKYLSVTLEHLATGYSNFFELLVQLQTLTKQNKELQTLSHQQYKLKMEELARANIPKAKLKKLLHAVKIAAKMEPAVTRDQYFSYLRSTENREISNLKSESYGMEEKLQRKVIPAISFLIWKIKEGTPLQGFCSLCPNIRIGDK